jgi:hypothetical protein
MEEEISVDHIAAATKYLERCRLAGDTRPVDQQLGDILSRRDTEAIRARVMALFAGAAS